MEAIVVGRGDDIIATGLAKGSAANGKRVALGDGKKIKWGPFSADIFRDNPNIAPPGSEGSSDLNWINYCKGHRIYNTQGNGKWIWNYDFKVTPGEIFFRPKDDISYVGDNLILIEPNVPVKPCGPNKQWPVDRFKVVADELSRHGFDVRQFEYGGKNVVADKIKTPTFRHAMALMSKARLAILPEGGLHHAAAALGIPAVVLFGGFVPPAVLGYQCHTNLTGGATACGTFNRCQHCVDAMNRITADEVLDAVSIYLS